MTAKTEDSDKGARAGLEDVAQRVCAMPPVSPGKFGQMMKELFSDAGFMSSAAVAAASYGFILHNGMPFPQFDKLAHIAGGYMVSRMGTHFSRAYRHGKHAAAYALLLTAAAGAAVEAAESGGLAKKLGAMVGIQFDNEEISYADMAANFVGWGAQSYGDRKNRTRP